MMSIALRDALASFSAWSGSAGDLVRTIAKLSPTFPAEWERELPSERVVRDWRVKGVFTHGKGARFGHRQVLECVAAVALKSAGWRLSQVAAFTEDASDDQILELLDQRDAAGLLPVREDDTGERAVMAATLLSQGVLAVFERVREGAVVRQDDRHVPPELHAALCSVGRLFIERGEPDSAACLHDVLDRCRSPLADWGPPAFRDKDFAFREAVLIDATLRVPTLDCYEVAESAGKGEQNVREQIHHQRLRVATEKYSGARRDSVYTLIRGFLVRNPLVRHDALMEYTTKHDLRRVRKEMRQFYDVAPRAWTIDGKIRRCARCGSMLRPSPSWMKADTSPCAIRQCHAKGDAGELSPIPYEDGEWLLARPSVLAYWVGPGLDELTLFRAAEAAGRAAELYPHSDAADVGVDGLELGIDAKSYTCPHALGMRLRRHGIGRLSLFKRRLLAIGDELVQANPVYLRRLREAMGPKVSRTIEAVSVSQAQHIIETGDPR